MYTHLTTLIQIYGINFPHEATRIDNARKEYKQQKATQTLSSLSAQPAFIPKNAMVPWTPQYLSTTQPQYSMQGVSRYTSIPPIYPGEQSVPPPPPTQDTPSSQQRLTMMGGRNERALDSARHNQNRSQ